MSDQSCSSESNRTFIHVVIAVHSAQTSQQTTDALLLLLILTLDWITGRRELRSFEGQSGIHAKPHHPTESAWRGLISSQDPALWGHGSRAHTHKMHHPDTSHDQSHDEEEVRWFLSNGNKSAPCKSQSCVIWLAVETSRTRHLV